MITRPLLASAIEDIDNIEYPQLVTPKFDGIRCLKVDGQVVSRNFKPQPNIFIRTTLEKILPDGVDGEIVLKGDKTFNDIQSEVMSFEGEPDFEFHIFDYVKDDLTKSYTRRIKDLEDWFEDLPWRNSDSRNRIKLILPIQINSIIELLKFESTCLEEGYEGVMLRSPTGRYKCGRSTIKEGILLKLKRFLDSEATIIGFTERLHNSNEQELNEFGLSKRSHKKSGMVASDTLGALLVRDLISGIEFELGTGYDDETRKEIWLNSSKLLGKIVKYKYQPTGVKDKPRFPVWLGFRSENDMS